MSRYLWAPRPFLDYPVSSIPVALREQPYVFFVVLKAVVPGEPIPVSFYFYGGFGPPAVSGAKGYRIRVLLGTSEIYAAPPTPDHYLPLEQTVPYAETHADRIELPVPDEGTSIGRHLYAFGSHELQLELTTDAPNSPVLTDHTAVSVIPEHVDYSWWMWPEQISPAKWGMPSLAWKQRYNITGRFLNKSIYTSKHVEARLIENYDAWNPVRTFSYPAQDVTAAPDASHPASVDLTLDEELVQDWDWTSFHCAPSADVDRRYTYRARFTLRDGYGNDYAEISADGAPYTDMKVWDERTGGLNVYVNVSDAKQNWAQGALALNILADAFSWLGLGAVFGPAANAACNQAHDPPVPDSDFLGRVAVRPSQLSFPSGAESAALRPVIELVDSVTRQAEALTEVQARFLGALEANNTRGIGLQRKAQQELFESMETDARRLWEAVDDLIPEPPSAGSDHADRTHQRPPATRENAQLKKILTSPNLAPALRALAFSVLRAVRTTPLVAELTATGAVGGPTTSPRRNHP